MTTASGYIYSGSISNIDDEEMRFTIIGPRKSVRGDSGASLASRGATAKPKCIISIGGRLKPPPRQLCIFIYVY